MTYNFYLYSSELHIINTTTKQGCYYFIYSEIKNKAIPHHKPQTNPKPHKKDQ